MDSFPHDEDTIYRSILRIHAYTKKYLPHRPPESFVSGNGTGTGLFVRPVEPKPFYTAARAAAAGAAADAPPSSSHLFFEGSMRARGSTMPRETSAGPPDPERDLFILTCAHVIESAYQIKVKLLTKEVENSEISATVVAYVPYDLAAFDADYHPKYDLALLHIRRPAYWPEDFRPHMLPLGDARDLKSGDTLRAFGFPLAQKGLSANKGVFSSFQHLIHHDVSIAPGNSGGPILNERGEVVGINNSGVTRVGAGNISYAVPIEFFSEFVGKFMFSLPVCPENDEAQRLAPWRVMHLPTFGFHVQNTTKMRPGARVTKIDFIEFPGKVVSLEDDMITVTLEDMGSHMEMLCGRPDSEDDDDLFAPACQISVRREQVVPMLNEDDPVTINMQVLVRFRGLDVLDNIFDLGGKDGAPRLEVGDTIVAVENIEPERGGDPFLTVDRNAEVELPWLKQRVHLFRSMQRFVDPHRSYRFRVLKHDAPSDAPPVEIGLRPRHHLVHGEVKRHPPYDPIPHVCCYGLMFVPVSLSLRDTTDAGIMRTIVCMGSDLARTPHLMLSFMVPDVPASHDDILVVGDILQKVNGHTVRTVDQLHDALARPVPHADDPRLEMVRLEFREGRVYEFPVAELLDYESRHPPYSMPALAYEILRAREKGGAVPTPRMAGDRRQIAVHLRQALRIAEAEAPRPLLEGGFHTCIRPVDGASQ